MELRTLIEQVTREVVAILEERNSSAGMRVKDAEASGGARGAGQTGPSAEESGTRGSGAGSLSVGQMTLILISSSPLRDEFIASLRGLLGPGAGEVWVLIPSHLEGKIESDLSAFLPLAKVLSHRDLRQAMEVCGRSSTVILVSPSAREILELASLSEGSLLSGLAVRGIREGKEVILLLEDTDDQGFSSSQVTRSSLVTRDDLRRVEEQGMRIVMIRPFARESVPGAGAVQIGQAAPPGVAESGCADESGAPQEKECNACGMCPSKIPDKVNKIIEAGACRIGATLGISPPAQELASMIDHTLLKPDATREEVLKLCEEARQFGFASVCVNPSHVRLASQCVEGSPVRVTTVVGFPLGATTTITKVMETRDALANGAHEIDMVVNVGALKARDFDLAKRDIEAVREASRGAVLKVILETALLSDEEKVAGCQISREAGADYVKTSTGFGPGGATEHDVALMRSVVGPHVGVKASGGIRDFETAQKMVRAGATRIGASASVAIVKQTPPASGKEKKY